MSQDKITESDIIVNKDAFNLCMNPRIEITWTSIEKAQAIKQQILDALKHYQNWTEEGYIPISQNWLKELQQNQRTQFEESLNAVTLQHFFSKITVNENLCWVWNGELDIGGYGSVRINGVLMATHRVMYLLEHKSIPEGKELDHLCRNRLCCNPSHLEAVTHRENMLRGQNPSAENAKKSLCKRGHKLEGSNLLPRSDGGRDCRICSRIRGKKFRDNRRDKKTNSGVKT
jgi:hypothetical protein